MLGLKDDKPKDSSAKTSKKEASAEDKKQASQSEEAKKVLAEINAKAGGDNCPFC